MERVATILRCEECGAVWLPADPERWRLVIADVDELAWYCAACFEREGSSATDVAESWDELRRLSDTELIRRHDESAPHTQTGVAWYREELRRSEVHRQTQALVVLTVIIAILTATNVVLVAWALFG